MCTLQGPQQAGPHVLAQLLHYLSSAPGTFSPQLGCLIGTACAGCVDGMGPSDLVLLAQARANVAPAPPPTPPGAAAASAEAGRGEGTVGRGEGQSSGGSGPPHRNGLTPWQQRLHLEVCRWGVAPRFSKGYRGFKICPPAQDHVPLICSVPLHGSSPIRSASSSQLRAFGPRELSGLAVALARLPRCTHSASLASHLSRVSTPQLQSFTGVAPAL